MAKWLQYTKKADFKQMGARLGIDQVLARILVNRGITEDEALEAYLHPSMDLLYDGSQMKDMAKAVAILKEAADEKKKIRIIGDYDIDGVQATYILHQGLLRLGAEVDYGIPHRVEDGYGLSEALIERCLEDKVEVIVTCDNGIAAAKEIQLAKDAGLVVVVTDHHEVPYEDVEGHRRYLLPAADAIVNPKQVDCAYPCKKLCGAAVAWKVVEELYKSYGFEKEAEQFIENAAFATVGDVMELVDENRTIVALGLKRLERTNNVGMRTLMARCQLLGKPLSAYHIGFVLGPCINATGRLDSATRAIELLEAKNEMEAAPLAEQLITLNDERKEMTEHGLERAIQIVGESYNKDEVVLVTYLPGVHESIAGIIAGRLRERFEKPCFVLVDAADGIGLKGSGRSMEGFSMYAEMCKCKEWFSKFGGHPMAAGLSLPKENLEAFRQAINRNTNVKAEELEPIIHIDVAMPFSYMSLDLVRQLNLLEPFGNGNSKPVFAQRNVTFYNMRRIGKQGQFIKAVACGEDGAKVEAVFFGDAEQFEAKFGDGKAASITYYPEINSYMGTESLQIRVTNF